MMLGDKNALGRSQPNVLAIVLLAAAAALPATADAQAAAGEELSAPDREALAWANQLASEASQIMERWIANKAITEERLFARLYYTIPQSEPIRFATDYDALADRDFIGPEEKTLGRSAAL